MLVNLVLVATSYDVSGCSLKKYLKEVHQNCGKLKQTEARVCSVDETGVDKLLYQKSHAETVTIAEFEMASNLQ